MNRTKEIIDALEPQRGLIAGAIAWLRKNAMYPEQAQTRSEQAIRSYVKNNAAVLGITSTRCVCWREVVEHFEEAEGK
jgi:hypothetical protein